MKLIYCPICDDIRKIRKDNTNCVCGRSWGRYLDSLNAQYGGKAIPLGIDNYSFFDALQKEKTKSRENGLGHRFQAFTIPSNCKTFVKSK